MDAILHQPIVVLVVVILLDPPIRAYDDRNLIQPPPTVVNVCGREPRLRPAIVGLKHLLVVPNHREARLVADDRLMMPTAEP